MSNARVHAEHSSDRQCDSHTALHKAPSIFLQYKEWLKSTLSIWSGQNRERCVFVLLLSTISLFFGVKYPFKVNSAASPFLGSASTQMISDSYGVMPVYRKPLEFLGNES